MKLVRGPSKSTLCVQWLWIFGNINQFSFYILGRRIRVFRCTLEKNGFHVFTVFARKPFQYVGKVISLMHVIGNVA